MAYKKILGLLLFTILSFGVINAQDDPINFPELPEGTDELCDGGRYIIHYRMAQFLHFAPFGCTGFGGCHENANVCDYYVEFEAPMGPLQYQPPSGGGLSYIPHEFYFFDGAGSRRQIFAGFCDDKPYEIVSIDPSPNSNNTCCQSPCGEEEPDVLYRFGIGALACQVYDATISLANYIVLEDGSRFELSFLDPGGNVVGSECGEEAPSNVYIPNNDPRPDAPRYRPIRPRPQPPLNPGDNPQPELPTPAPSALAPCLDVQGVFQPPEVWNANEAFDFNDYLGSIGYVLDYAFVLDKSTGIFNFVEDPDKYYFNADGRDEWGRVVMRIEMVELATGAKCVLEEEMEILDYGLYFYSDGENNRKVTNGHPVLSLGSDYFDPNKPTVVYVHGRNENSVQDHQRERLLGLDNETMVNRWKVSGYNVGIYYWNHFSDRGLNPFGIDGIENIIYNPSPNGVPWRKENFNVTADEASPILSVSFLLKEQIEKIQQAASAGTTLRLVGHSMGGQLVLNTATVLSTPVDRLTLLDPWWTSNKRPDVEQNLTQLLGEVPVELYSSSLLNDIPQYFDVLKNGAQGANGVRGCAQGNPNSCITAIERFYDVANAVNELRSIHEKTCYVNLTPTHSPFNIFEPVSSLENKHYAAVDYYFRSINSSSPQLVTLTTVRQYNQGENGDVDLDFNSLGVDGISASNCTEFIREAVGKRFDQVSGGNSLSVSDDAFLDFYLSEEQFRLDANDDLYLRPESNGSLVEDSQSLPVHPVNDADLSVPSQPSTSAFSEIGTTGQGDIDHGNTQTKNFNGEFTREDPLVLGVPSPASSTFGDDYLINNQEGGYAVSFNCGDHVANWSAWHLNRAWLGDMESSRTRFLNGPNPSSASCPPVRDQDYECAELFSRGHLCPGGDRSYSSAARGATYSMVNVVPQNQANNHGVWLNLETHLRVLARTYNLEMYIIAGGRGIGGFNETSEEQTPGVPFEFVGGANSKVPQYLWKAVLFIPEGTDDLTRIASGDITVAGFGFWVENQFAGSQGNFNDQGNIISLADLEANLASAAVSGEPPITLFGKLSNEVKEEFFNEIPENLLNPLMQEREILFNGPGDYSANNFTASSTSITAGGNVTFANAELSTGGNHDICGGNSIIINSNSLINSATLLRVGECAQGVVTLGDVEEAAKEEEILGNHQGVKSTTPLNSPASRANVASAPYQLSNALHISPNPFQQSFTTTYALPAAGVVSLTLYDQTGRVVQSVISGDYLLAGRQEHEVFTRGLPRGVYFLRLRTEKEVVTRKLIKQ